MTNNPSPNPSRARSKKLILIMIIGLQSIALLFGYLYFTSDNRNETTTDKDVDPTRTLQLPEETNEPQKQVRFEKISQSIVADHQRGVSWLIAPDRNFTLEEAQEYARSLSDETFLWRVPSYSELSSLYSPGQTAGTGYYTAGRYFPAKMDPVFSAVGSGSWFWVSDGSKDPEKVFVINLHLGTKIETDRFIRDFPVHLLLVKNGTSGARATSTGGRGSKLKMRYAD